MNNSIVEHLFKSRNRSPILESEKILGKRFYLDEADEDEEKLSEPSSFEDYDGEEEENEEEPETEKDEEDSEDLASEEEETPPEKNTEKHPNPLENDYAINFKIGDEVSLAYANGTSTTLNFVIDGYDKNGFYRVMWEDGSTSEGFTDAALSALSDYKESKCICGSQTFVKEGKSLVCDKCGRLRESEGKKKSRIYSKPNNVNTGNSPDIAESIKRAFKKKSLDENSFIPLLQLKGEFWSSNESLVDSIEELGFEVMDINDEYVLISDEEGRELQIPLISTLKTRTLNLEKLNNL